jgi:hypothetical protein
MMAALWSAIARNSMAGERFCWSRRAALGAALQSIWGALLFQTAPAQAADKMTRARAEYQDTPNGIYSCGMCSLFEAPNGCKVVEGEVSKEGWCKAFALQD